MLDEPNCMVDAATLTAFAEHRLLSEEESALLAHLMECRKCQKELREVYESLLSQDLATLSDEEKSGLRKLVHSLVSNTERLMQRRHTGWLILEGIADCKPLALAAADDQTADQKLLKSALSANSLYFAAMCDKAHPCYWRAEILLPTVPVPETELVVRISDARGNALSGGTLVFCDIEREVDKGRCIIALSELRQNLKKQTISFAFPTGESIAGWLELFPEDLEDS